MNCRFCEARGHHRKLPATLAKRIHHYTANHPDVVAGMSMRIASNPRAFGMQLGQVVQNLLKTSGAVRLVRMLEKEGVK